MTAEELIAKAAACLTCGKEHEPWQAKPPPMAKSWASREDGHSYRSTLPTHIVAQLRELAGAS